MHANWLVQAAQARVEALLNPKVFDFAFFSVNIGHNFIANDHIIPSGQSLYARCGVDCASEEVESVVELYCETSTRRTPALSTSSPSMS
jgi:hypothetical protein